MNPESVLVKINGSYLSHNFFVASNCYYSFSNSVLNGKIGRFETTENADAVVQWSKLKIQNFLDIEQINH